MTWLIESEWKIEKSELGRPAASDAFLNRSLKKTDLRKRTSLSRAVPELQIRDLVNRIRTEKDQFELGRSAAPDYVLKAILKKQT